MQFMIDFVAEDLEFREILRRAGGFGLVQGVVLDIDPLWLRAWQIAQSAGNEYLAELARMTEQDFSDKQRMQAVDEKFDIIALGGVPSRA